MARAEAAATRMDQLCAPYEVFFAVLGAFPGNTASTDILIRSQSNFLSTFRPLPFHLTTYKFWISLAISTIFTSPMEYSFVFGLSSWYQIGSHDRAVQKLPTKTDHPQIQIGHLFSPDVFGNETDAPLHYIQIVRDMHSAIKVVVSPSRRELVSSVYYEASCGFSTVLICAVCQNMTSILSSLNLNLEGIKSLIVYKGHTVKQAEELLAGDDKKIAIIC
jgi:hypothetical protein